MERLPRDVQLIVWRYLRNDSYDKVVEQFKADYVKYWSDSSNYYISLNNGLCIRANWRYLIGAKSAGERRLKWEGTPIYRLFCNLSLQTGKELHAIPKGY